MTQNPKQKAEFEECSDNRPSKISKIEYPNPSDEEEEEENEAKALIEEEQKQGMSQNHRIQRYLLAIEYIGTRFCGSQKQLNGHTVMGALEDAFCKFIGQPVSITCSSRTDAGVHALSNVCHVDIERLSKRRPTDVVRIKISA